MPAVSRRTLRFNDGTKVAVNGLSEIMADLFSEGMQADSKTAEEIIRRLEAAQNYIPTSGWTRREYAQTLLAEYKEYIDGRDSGSKSSI